MAIRGERTEMIYIDDAGFWFDNDLIIHQFGRTLGDIICTHTEVKNPKIIKHRLGTKQKVKT